MKLLTTLAMTLAMVAVTSAVSTADAQQYNNGYRFGAGINAGQGYGNFSPNRANRGCRGPFFGTIGVSPRIEEPPYFAKFPPVYYSGIVPRPYGVSPYAAPPGIAPVEMSAPVISKKVINPFFNNEAAPVSETKDAQVEDESVELNDSKVTWQKNPYKGNIVTRN